MKPKYELSVAAIGALAESYLEIKAASDVADPSEALPRMAAAFGKMAARLDAAIPSQRPNFAAMNLPTFLATAADLIPKIVEANRAQLEGFAAAGDKFGTALSAVTKAD
jgi:hypothetical protein